MPAADVLTLREGLAMVDAALAAGRLRDAALMMTGLALGLRVGDLTKLTFRTLFTEDGNFRDPVVLREEKTGRTRILHIPAWAQPVLRRYWDEYYTGDLDQRMFPISRERAWQITRRYAKLCKIDKRVSPHSLRKAFCRAVYELTRDPALTAQITGHSSPQALLVYIQAASPAVEQVWAEFSRLDPGKGGGV